jgi:hypothetical protein
MAQHWGQLSNRVMNSMGHMDTDGFVRQLVELDRYMLVERASVQDILVHRLSQILVHILVQKVVQRLIQILN